jgi:heptaprenyl diphosphate synthase
MMVLKTAPEELNRELAEVELALYQYIRSDSSLINNGITHLLEGGGKRIRPLLCLIGAHYGTPSSRLVDVATMPEMLHLASLIHDDIIDEADSRRGVKTLHKSLGTDIAVYAGDLIIVDTLHRMLDYYDQAYYREFSSDLLQIVRGEIRQMSMRKSYEPSLKHYMRVIEGKTARLLKLSLKMGMAYADVPKDIQKTLVQIVHELGLAFQIVDDCLDYQSHVTSLGKPVLQDLKNGYMTLPAILRGKKEPQFIAKLKQKGITRSALKSAEGFKPYVDEAMHYAKKLSKRAIKRIDGLGEHPMNAPLRELVETLLVRSL